ncbi:uncharacterized protein [Dermacentor albipictus]|uniref:uncharacterized protein isoform X2 n=1 Tax=Dermacentor albipictus TaxID=60249 RepID=UPI0038FC8733
MTQFVLRGRKLLPPFVPIELADRLRGRQGEDAVFEKQDTVHVPSPNIPLPQPKQEPGTRVNMEGGGTAGGGHKVSGTVEYDTHRSDIGATVTGRGRIRVTWVGGARLASASPSPSASPLKRDRQAMRTGYDREKHCPHAI